MFSRSSLFMKLMYPLVALFVAGGVGLAMIVPDLVSDNVEQQAVDNARRTVDQFKAIRAYYTKNVIAKVLGSGALKPSYNHAQEKDAVPLPATMIHDLSGLLEKEGTNLKLYSAYPFPVRGKRQLDAFQQEAWQTLSKNPDAVFTRREVRDGRETIRVAIADKMVADACVACHNNHPETPKTGWKLGDVRGVLEVQSNLEDSLAAGNAISNTILFTVGALGLVAFIATFLIFRTTIGRPLQLTVEALDHIADGDGDLTRRLNAKGEHEIGRIGRAFNRFAEKIAHTVSAMVSEGQELHRIAGELSQISDATNRAIQRQDRDTEMIATAVSELAASAREIAGSASAAASETEQTASTTRVGKTTTEKSVRATAELLQEIETATEALAHLKNNSDNISSVLDVIRAIAEQTNLLALNAAIEAARAGEQGRGFAVVADEVRTLANRTQESTEEIQAMTEQLRNATDSVVATMHNSRDKAGATLGLAEQVGEQLNAVAASIDNIAGMNGQMARASNEQSQVAENVNGNVHGIYEMAQTTSDGAEKLTTQIGELERAVQNLQAISKQFRI
ncbi:MAG: methyl-accepting chemotaxis protein [Gammaproteobacteria bacterium]|nr:methyl-accepting chemotaxis protein [Gammaproteobacteria bacterium]